MPGLLAVRAGAVVVRESLITLDDRRTLGLLRSSERKAQESINTTASTPSTTDCLSIEPTQHNLSQTFTVLGTLASAWTHNIDSRINWGLLHSYQLAAARARAEPAPDTVAAASHCLPQGCKRGGGRPCRGATRGCYVMQSHVQSPITCNHRDSTRAVLIGSRREGALAPGLLEDAAGEPPKVGLFNQPRPLAKEGAASARSVAVVLAPLMRAVA
jgi:hypothetical protein